MTEELDIARTSKSAYEPVEVEARLIRRWHEHGVFNFRHEPGKPTFAIALPPPNITGSLHMGHALNGTIQDALCRYKRMRGTNVLWQPGTDHAGISAQRVVVRKLDAEGRKWFDMGRDAFQTEVWEWRDKYGNAIFEQYKRIGVSFAWNRPAFTLDDNYVRAVYRAFTTFYREGLIYRGKRVTDWCPSCRTSLSDLEVTKLPQQAPLYLIDYPLADGSGEALTVATTRPETMFGDAAVAVHPKDERYAGFIGKMVRMPATGREIPVITDRHVEREFGTGALRITPAHSQADWEIAQRQGCLKAHVVLDNNAKLLACEFVPEKYHGMDRLAARTALIEQLTEEGFFKGTQNHEQAAGHCERCGTLIEPMLTDQWYLRMSELAKPAIEVVEKGEIRFIPERHKHTYLDWMRDVKDWNISRQLWWGHRIPLWTCDEGHLDAYEAAPEKCAHCESKRLEQDPDVLDTWFSSALWPFATMGWPDEKAPLLEAFYPTAALSTARDIINLWVSRMIFTSLKFVGKIPFKDVLIHPTILGPDGKPMSKSRGNVVDPLAMIEIYGTDAMRMFFATIGIHGEQAVPFREDRLAEHKRFVTKLFNAGRFVMTQLGDFKPGTIDRTKLTLADRWILHRYNALLGKLEKAFDNYEFSEIARELHDFTWDCFCDWYLEIAKTQIAEEQADGQTRQVLYTVFEGLLRAMSPIMPFITEELWSQMPRAEGAEAPVSIMFADYPRESEENSDERADWEMTLLMRSIRAIREIRATYIVPNKAELDVFCMSENADELAVLQSGAAYFKRLARANPSFDKLDSRPANSATAAVSSIKLYVSLANAIDITAARARLDQRKGSLGKEITKLAARFDNPEFQAKAPADKVEAMAATLSDLRKQLASVEEQLETLT